MTNLHDIRREYGNRPLVEELMPADPLAQLKAWLEDAINNQVNEPTAFVLATVDEQGWPDARVLLLKEITEQGLIFFTNYRSSKAQQIALNPRAAITFYWAELVRQVRIRGTIQKIPVQASKDYFASRPRDSQLSVYASQQSQVITDREELEKNMWYFSEYFQEKSIPCPEFWGGYELVVQELEFFQGRDARLHDRIRYRKVEKKWLKERLSP